jgi:hypothetical protein
MSNDEHLKNVSPVTFSIAVWYNFVISMHIMGMIGMTEWVVAHTAYQQSGIGRSWRLTPGAIDQD